MKRLRTIIACMALTLIAATSLCGRPVEKKQPRPPKRLPVVLVCTGSTNKVFHTQQECPVLKQCDQKIKIVTLSRAQNAGRTHCALCSLFNSSK
ncbi:MAG: hypothetical protein IJY36_03110 [Coprobacter sp.]|nr:hypothetical protein [Coprobacter sp.]